MEYDHNFYQRRRAMTLPAARKVLSIVAQHTKFSSVADFGCGVGTWLSVAKQMGADRAVGFEGDWVTHEMLDDKTIDLRRGSLENRVSLDSPVDLAISLEVAEHLSPGRADTFVEDICAAAPYILFSAAIPGQGGKGHINEQWQSYWAEKFAARGYKIFDVVRPEILGDQTIPYWYQQNTMLLMRAEAAPHALLPYERKPESMDFVHSSLFERARKKRKPLIRKIKERLLGRK